MTAGSARAGKWSPDTTMKLANPIGMSSALNTSVKVGAPEPPSRGSGQRRASPPHLDAARSFSVASDSGSSCETTGSPKPENTATRSDATGTRTNSSRNHPVGFHSATRT